VQGGPMMVHRLFQAQDLNVFVLRGSRMRTLPLTIEREPGTLAAMIPVSGTLLFRAATKESWSMAPPKTFCHLNSSRPIRATASRGAQEHLLFTWSESQNRGLTDWVSQLGDRSQVSLFQGSNNLDHGRMVARVIEHSLEPRQHTYPELIGDLAALIGVAHTGSFVMSLTDITAEFPQPLRVLLNEVKENPTGLWSLKVASAHAGYSQFHLSRTFRNLVGYGFPEFVDRCRTESSVRKMIADPDLLIDEIAMNTGFGSTQAMRDAFRQYLGFLPSEVRASSEIADS